MFFQLQEQLISLSPKTFVLKQSKGQFLGLLPNPTSVFWNRLSILNAFFCSKVEIRFCCLPIKNLKDFQYFLFWWTNFWLGKRKHLKRARSDFLPCFENVAKKEKLIAIVKIEWKWTITLVVDICSQTRNIPSSISTIGW